MVRVRLVGEKSSVALRRQPGSLKCPLTKMWPSKGRLERARTPISVLPQMISASPGSEGPQVRLFFQVKVARVRVRTELRRAHFLEYELAEGGVEAGEGVDGEDAGGAAGDGPELVHVHQVRDPDGEDEDTLLSQRRRRLLLPEGIDR